jgi:hypothetical protein
MGGAFSTNGEEEHMYIAGMKARGTKSTRKTKTYVDNTRITMVLGEIGWGSADWIGSDQDRDKWRALVNAVMNLRAP